MLNIIVAPTNICAKAERITKSVVKFLKQENVEYSVFFSLSIDNVTENVKKLISSGETDFIVVGNDAVLHSVINSVKDISKIKLGIIPTGKHDDFAEYLELNSHPVQAIKDILENNIEQVDYLLVNDMKVLNNVIIGATVETAQAYEQFKLKNFITEKFATMNYGNKFEGVELNLETKAGKRKKETVFELVIANGGLNKGKPVSPLSNVKDGLFNLIYFVDKAKKANRKFSKKIKKGDHIYDEDAKQHWLSALKISNDDKKIKAMVDGKIVNLEELNISLVENGLKLYKKKD